MGKIIKNIISKRSRIYSRLEKVLKLKTTLRDLPIVEANKVLKISRSILYKHEYNSFYQMINYHNK